MSVQPAVSSWRCQMVVVRREHVAATSSRRQLWFFSNLDTALLKAAVLSYWSSSDVSSPQMTVFGRKEDEDAISSCIVLGGQVQHAFQPLARNALPPICRILAQCWITITDSARRAGLPRHADNDSRSTSTHWNARGRLQIPAGSRVQPCPSNSLRHNGRPRTCCQVLTFIQHRVDEIISDSQRDDEAIHDEKKCLSGGSLL